MQGIANFIFVENIHCWGHLCLAIFVFSATKFNAAGVDYSIITGQFFIPIDIHLKL